MRVDEWQATSARPYRAVHRHSGAAGLREARRADADVELPALCAVRVAVPAVVALCAEVGGRGGVSKAEEIRCVCTGTPGANTQDTVYVRG